jgi:hypothetical protein
MEKPSLAEAVLRGVLDDPHTVDEIVQAVEEGKEDEDDG